MKRKVIAIITAILMMGITAFIPGGIPQTAQAADYQNWANVGNAGFSAGAAHSTSLAIDSNNTLYVAYGDGGNSGKATVMRWDGSTWETVGNAGFSAGGAYQISLAIDSSDTPYVAFKDNENGDKSTVMKWDGSTWETVGKAGFSAGEAYHISLAIDSSDTPYVAYEDYENSGKATVMKWDGSAWVTVGNAGFSEYTASYISLAIDSSGTPYVAFRDGWNSCKTTVMRWNGSAWVTVGNAGFSAGKVDNISLAIDSSDTPYVAYRDHGNSYKATVMKWDVSTWETVGNASCSAGGVYSISLAIDSSDTPYVAYRDYSNSFKATVVKWDGSFWVMVGNAGFSEHTVFNTSLAIESNGTPYVAFKDKGNSDKATVMKLNTMPNSVNLSNNAVAENEPAGTVVGTFSAEDIDIIDSYTFALVSGDGDNDNASFTIDGDMLKTNAVLDFETRSTYKIRVQMADAGGLTVQRTFIVNVTDEQGDANDNGIIVDLGSVIPEGAVGSTYSFSPNIVNGSSPFNWSVTGLPTGLSIDGSTGEISGVPTNIGTSAVSVTVTDSLNESLTVDFDIQIGHANLAIDTPNLLAATLGESYCCTLTASGGDGNNAWYASGLPSGLSIERDTGKITGTPNETGTFSVNARVYDGEGRKATKTYSLTVSSPSETGKYEIVPDTDSAYTVSTVDGFTTLTINHGVTGFQYICVSVNPIVAHEGEEACVFVHMRDGVQIGFSFSVDNYDADGDAGTGFNIKTGDIIKVYIVDELTNDLNSNPVLLQ